MAKKQTRRSISVSRTTYERLKAFCEANNISMSQLVETRVNDFLGGETVPLIPRSDRPAPTTTSVPTTPRPPTSSGSSGGLLPPKQSTAPVTTAPAQVVPMTSAAARYAVEPPPPVIKMTRPTEEAAPKPAEKRPDQIFTF